MRVLVTGGYGFLGAWIARDLLDHGHQPVLFDLASNPRRLEMVLSAQEIQSLPFAQGDVADSDRLLAACKEHRIGGIIHLAGLQVPTCRAKPLEGARVNVLGTLSVSLAVFMNVLDSSIANVAIPTIAADLNASSSQLEAVIAIYLIGYATLIVTGDARSNYRETGAEAFGQIASKARRVYWLNPEPTDLWGTDDSIIDDYRRSCTNVFEVRTLGQLADVIAELV